MTSCFECLLNVRIVLGHIVKEKKEKLMSFCNDESKGVWQDLAEMLAISDKGSFYDQEKLLALSRARRTRNSDRWQTDACNIDLCTSLMTDIWKWQFTTTQLLPSDIFILTQTLSFLKARFPWSFPCLQEWKYLQWHQDKFLVCHFLYLACSRNHFYHCACSLVSLNLW